MRISFAGKAGSSEQRPNATRNQLSRVADFARNCLVSRRGAGGADLLRCAIGLGRERRTFIGSRLIIWPRGDAAAGAVILTPVDLRPHQASAVSADRIDANGTRGTHDPSCRVAAQAEAPTMPNTLTPGRPGPLQSQVAELTGAPGRAVCKSVSRIAFHGELSPQSGAADLLIAVASWAEQHLDHLVQVWWLGDGDLVGVLDAQPLPSNVTQRFFGCLDPLAAEDIFSQCTLLAVPSLTEHRASPVAQAMAAGLPVLGSQLDREVRRFVREGATGWLYNPLRPVELSAALDRALATPAPVLAQMGGNASAAVRPALAGGLSERVVRAIATMTPDFVPECPGEAFAQPAR